jgi:hypothetical protein
LLLSDAAAWISSQTVPYSSGVRSLGVAFTSSATCDCDDLVNAEALGHGCLANHRRGRGCDACLRQGWSRPDREASAIAAAIGSRCGVPCGVRGCPKHGGRGTNSRDRCSQPISRESGTNSRDRCSQSISRASGGGGRPEQSRC